MCWNKGLYSFYIHLLDVSIDSRVVSLPVHFILHCLCFDPNTVMNGNSEVLNFLRIMKFNFRQNIELFSLSSVPSVVQ